MRAHDADRILGLQGQLPALCVQQREAALRLHAECQTLGGRLLEQSVLDELFEVLQPAALAATVEAFKEAEAHHAQRTKAFALAVERARFEADRAHRQFEQVEPENRLVARTLERAWEGKLAALRRAESDLAAQQAHRPAALTEEEISWVKRAGADVRAIFDDSPLAVFHTRAVVSLLPVTTNRPPGLKATLVTASPCAGSLRSSTPVDASQIDGCEPHAHRDRAERGAEGASGRLLED